MNLIIPPLCDPTVPLLGPFQIAGYAKTNGYPFFVYDYNILFFRHIIEYAQSICQKSSRSCDNTLDSLEYEACVKFIASFGTILSYRDVLDALKNCQSTEEYWHLIDYARACYDFYSLKFNGLHFRLEGFDCNYRWHIWQDIDDFISAYISSDLMDIIHSWLKNFNFAGLRIIGINVTFESQLFFTVLFCIALRKEKPDIYIIVGGGFINTFIDSADAMGPLEKYCDTIFAAEGEALIHYLRLLETGSPNGLRSLGKRTHQDYANFVSAKDLCETKLEVCPPNIAEDQLSMYFSPSKVLPLRFSYDCYWGKCKFCADKEQHDCLEPVYDYQKMIDYCTKQKNSLLFDNLYFLDSAISFHVLKMFSEAIIRNNTAFTWGTNVRLDAFFADESFVALLARAGCVFLKFGLESGSQKVLDLMHKGIDIENAAKTIHLCRRYNILAHVYIIAAYPGETDFDREKTKIFLLDDFSHPDNYSCSEFILYKTASLGKELSYSFPDEPKKVAGWHSSSFSFSNDATKTFIAEMRRDFSEKFSPANILISTGHTIALARKFKTRKTKTAIVLRNDTRFRISNVVVQKCIKGKNISGKWRRRDGIIYLSDPFLQKISECTGDFSISDALLQGGSLPSLFELICEGFLEITVAGNGISLDCSGKARIEFNYGNKFNELKWHGYYDAD
jgi:hypothetical protein